MPVTIRECSLGDLASLLPFPAANANKYTRGKLVVIAGSKHYPGAAMLAARASMRAGAGYTEVLCSASAVPLVQGFCPSAVTREYTPALLDETIHGLNRSRHPRAIVIGPGFDVRDLASRQHGNRMLFQVLEQAKCPVLVDGGALADMGREDIAQLCRNRRDNDFSTVLTPHAGEAARILNALGIDAETPAADERPASSARIIARELGACVALKGPDTIISFDDELHILRSGSAALAKAGTGDVLAGIIGALLAQGLAPSEAAILGCSLHACAGLAAEAEQTSICVTAEDIIDYLPEAVKAIQASQQAQS